MLIICVLLGALTAFLAFKLHDIKHKTREIGIKWEQIFLASPHATIVIDSQGQIEMLNSKAQKLTGWTFEQALGLDYSLVYHTRRNEGDPISEVLKGGNSSRSQAFLQVRKGGELAIKDRILPILGRNNQIMGVIVSFEIMTRRESGQARIAHLTFKDSLTGLYNRTFFEQELPRLDTPEHLPLSILVGDLNGLKLTNDVFGHSVGDELLILVSQTLLEVCRPEDRVFRWGGDEFLILMPNTDFSQAKEIRERLAKCLAKRNIGSITVDLPLGCSTKVEVTEDIHAIWQQAEEEMYWSKTIGQKHFQKATLDGIVKELHQGNQLEKEHAERVSVLAEDFGRYLGLSSDQLRKLRVGGLLHDVGKIALDKDLLYKSHPLRPEDEHEMKRHPLVGFRLLNYFEDTADLAVLVLAHHEQWDGSGYPKGLKGDEIPYLARILTLVGTYDRVHSYGDKRALEVIAKGAGKAFDPALVEVFLQMMQKKSA